MIEAVFISDLHLNPAEEAITARFNQFIDWAAEHTKLLYILGDFFHVWAGDDSMDTWSNAIIERLLWLKKQGVTVYFMCGNRDFLLGEDFIRASGVVRLSDPSIIRLGKETIVLTHGDQYCLADRTHQWFRFLTRNRLFISLFLKFPLPLRKKLVSAVRQRSQTNQKPNNVMGTIPSAIIAALELSNATMAIHGHTHQCGTTRYEKDGRILMQYILSDWDDIPKLLCYDYINSFKFI